MFAVKTILMTDGTGTRGNAVLRFLFTGGPAREHSGKNSMSAAPSGYVKNTPLG